MKIKPLFARVLLERERLTSSSIIIPEDAAKRNASLKCRVLSKGPSADETITIGATVLIGKYAGEWFTSSGKAVSGDDTDAELYIVMDEDIIGEIV